MNTVRQWMLLLRYRIASLLKYPADIFLGIFGTILWHIPNFVLIEVIFYNMDDVMFEKGYLILLYGLSVFGDGMQHTFAEALWQFGNTYIKTAKFDEILTKPASNFLQVITSRFDIDGFGGIIWGMFCCMYGYNLLQKFSMIGLIKIVIAMIISTCIFLSINICTSAFAFLLYDNFYLTHTIFDLHKFARFPKDLYPKAITFLLTFVFPVFVATYYPTNYIFYEHWFGLFIYLAIGIIMLFGSIFLWNKLSFFYKSSGS